MKQGFVLTKDEVLGIYGELENIVLTANGLPESKETLVIKGACQRILTALKPEKDEQPPRGKFE